MRKILSLIVCLIFISSLWSGVYAGVIGSYTFSTLREISPDGYHCLYAADWGVNISIHPEMYPADIERTSLFNGADADDPYGSKTTDIFNNIGHTVWMSSNQDDPEYSYFVNKLTDGTTNYLRIWLLGDMGDHGIGGFGYLMPLNELTRLPEQYNQPYLQGYTIDRIGLSIDSASYTYDQSATYPHIYNWQLTFTIEGTPPVPEPSSLATLIAGIGGLGVGIRNKRKDSHRLTSKTVRKKETGPFTG